MTPYDMARKTVAEIAHYLDMHRSDDGVEETLRHLALQPQHPQAVSCAQKPVLRHLRQAVANADPAFSELGAALLQLHGFMKWSQNPKYTDAIMGAGFTENYAWGEIIGQEGLLSSQDFILGFLILGPGQHYIDHWHKAPELYVPMNAGSMWSKNEGAFMARRSGEIIWHPSMAKHAMKTGAAPMLAIYAWTKDTNGEIYLPS